MLALKQASVINDLKGRKDCRHEGKAVKRNNNSKDNVSVVKTPSSVSIVKISRKNSITRLTGT